MSPFAKTILDLRKKRGYKQKDMAIALGYEQSYISALEVGAKGLPTKEFTDKLKSVLKLDEIEKMELDLAIVKSERKVLLPINASENLYQFCYELRLNVEKLLPSQIELMQKILRLPHELKQESIQERV